MGVHVLDHVLANGLIVRLVIETASLVEVDTSTFGRRSLVRYDDLTGARSCSTPGRAPHQSIAERFSAMADRRR